MEHWLPSLMFLAIAAVSYVFIRQRWPERATRWLWHRVSN